MIVSDTVDWFWVLARKARLDRCYLSLNLANLFIKTKAKTMYTSCLSDHYPLMVTLDNKDSKIRNQWFHTDPDLFSLPVIKEQVQVVWDQAFTSSSPARAWNQAIKQTQSLLVSVRKKVSLFTIPLSVEQLVLSLPLADSKGRH